MAASRETRLPGGNILVARSAREPRSPVRLSLAPLESEVVSAVRPALVAAAGAVVLVLMVACANLTNLLLARTSARTREMAVRLAVGAGRRNIVQQMLSEGLVIGAVGAAGGWTLAHWGVGALLALAPAALPRREAIVVDGGLAVVAIAIAFSCAIAVSLVPAWQAVRSDMAGRTRRAALAVTLAAIGVYGVVSYAMAQRTREIAVRLALGASSQRLVARVLARARNRRVHRVRRLPRGAQGASGRSSASGAGSAPRRGWFSTSSRCSFESNRTMR